MGEVRQGGMLVAEYHDLTANQLMVLLAVYTGRDDIALMMIGTWVDDLEFLVKIGLAEFKSETSSHVKITSEGNSYINNILTVTIEKETIEKTFVKLKSKE